LAVVAIVVLPDSVRREMPSSSMFPLPSNLARSPLVRVPVVVASVVVLPLVVPQLAVPLEFSVRIPVPDVFPLRQVSVATPVPTGTVPP
jgi:hypothetical protein